MSTVSVSSTFGYLHTVAKRIQGWMFLGRTFKCANNIQSFTHNTCTEQLVRTGAKFSFKWILPEYMQTSDIITILGRNFDRAIRVDTGPPILGPFFRWQCLIKNPTNKTCCAINTRPRVTLLLLLKQENAMKIEFLRLD